MAKKPWSGRFRKNTAGLMEQFSESVSFDVRLAEDDIQGSLAHVRVLAKAGVLSRHEAARLSAALEEIQKEAAAGKIKWRPELEDVHMNIEHLLRARVGELAGKLHTGRSRNDQVALDMRLYFRTEAQAVEELLTELGRTFVRRAEEFMSAIMPGFTHTRKAQPVLFAHHLLAYVEMFLRDRSRFCDCRRRMNFSPLGAGALAGTTFPLDRELAARQLGFDGIMQNSIDAVSDRDFLLEFAAASAITMIHLSRLAEELIWWSLPEIGFLELEESFCTGSSMMPNKKNPDAAELVRGKTGRVVGSLIALLVTMKGTPLSYNRDFQEDKEGMFDLADTLKKCLLITERLVATMRPNPARMRAAAEEGFVLATDVADYLAAKGLPFRQAHEITGRLVRHCEERGCKLEDLSLADLKRFSPLFEKEVKEWLNLEAAVKRRQLPGGTAPSEVKKQLRRLQRELQRDPQRVLARRGPGR